MTFVLYFDQQGKPPSIYVDDSDAANDFDYENDDGLSAVRFRSGIRSMSWLP